MYLIRSWTTQNLSKMQIALVSVILFLAVACAPSNAKLSARGSGLYYNGQQVFLSGTNIAWQNYARDFGSGSYAQVKAQYQAYIDELSQNGGNAIRVWVHVDGQLTPAFDSNGHATGRDTASLISDLGELLDYAAQKDVFVILCLWNLAVKPDPMIHLYTDPAALDSYLNNVLTPLVAGLKNKPALAAYDVINEPIGAFAVGRSDPNPCYDTTNLVNSGADWSNSHLAAKDILSFINKHAAAIKAADPDVLVTVGESGEVTATTLCSQCKDYYVDSCLVGAGGQPRGTIDFYQLHSYTWQGSFSANSVFKKTYSDYKNGKPIIVGEFATVCSESQNAPQNYEYVYNNGFSGALSWQYNQGGNCADSRSVTDQGVSSIKDNTAHGKIKVKILS